MHNTVQVDLPDGMFDSDTRNGSSTDTTLVLPEGVHADGFEGNGSGCYHSR